ncbi:MAG: dihydrofolate reductase family protein [Chitinophagaceae bacterium]
MRKLNAFLFLSVNGFFKAANEDISWHRHGGEENEFSIESLKSNNILLFGRVTYEMMVNYWSSPMAKENDPVVAKGINSADKIVFSKTLKKADWNNTKIISDAEEIKNLKQTPGKNMTILGSGTIITQFANQNLIDEYQFMIDPVALGNGTPIFQSIKNKLDLNLTNSRTFKSGVVLLSYEPVKNRNEFITNN